MIEFVLRVGIEGDIMTEIKDGAISISSSNKKHTIDVKFGITDYLGTEKTHIDSLFFDFREKNLTLQELRVIDVSGGDAITPAMTDKTFSYYLLFE